MSCYGMTEAEWMVICIACDMIRKDGGDPKDYFDYDIDSSD